MIALFQHGTVEELTGQRRNRVFVYAEYLPLLNEGGQSMKLKAIVAEFDNSELLRERTRLV